MGGELRCQSVLGQGSVFTFSLPCRPCAAPPSEVTDDGALSGLHLSGRVLVADDSPVNAMIARAMLEMMGLEVDVAEDGQAALDQLGRTPYAAVLMDCQMPVLDGWRATRQWRVHEGAMGSPHVPIIALTANAVLGDRERCLEAGMDDYLPKPFELRDLAALMRRHLTPGL
jgi:CheY-like chemotaxis protein